MEEEPKLDKRHSNPGRPPGTPGGGPGKKPGTLGKRTILRMGVLDKMFHRLGGEENYGYWLQKHTDFFYEEWTKMIIRERINKGGMNIDANVTFKWADDGATNNGPL